MLSLCIRWLMCSAALPALTALLGYDADALTSAEMSLRGVSAAHT